MPHFKTLINPILYGPFPNSFRMGVGHGYTHQEQSIQTAFLVLGTIFPIIQVKSIRGNQNLTNFMHFFNNIQALKSSTTQFKFCTSMTYPHREKGIIAMPKVEEGVTLLL